MASPADIGNDIARTMNQASRAVDKAIREVAREGVKVAREEMNKTAAQSAGPDRKFSQAKTGGKLQVRARFDGSGSVITPAGLWGLAEKGAKPGGKGRHANHPGTQGPQGRRAWSRGREATFARLDKELPAKVDQVMTGALDA